MSHRSRNARMMRAAFPGFAVPARFLAFGAMGWMGLFLVAVAWSVVTAWLDGATVWELLMPAPFVVGVVWAARMAAAAHARGDLAGVVRGVRVARWTVLAACTLLAGGMLISFLWTGEVSTILFGLFMAVFMAAVFIGPLLGPLWLFERRLRARVSLGNPAWHPRLASITQRGEAALAFCGTVGAFSCAIIAMRYALSQMTSFNGETFRETGAITMLGFAMGFGVGCAPGALISYALNDRDLSRALPPLALWTPLAALAGSFAGVGWGLGAVVVTMLVVGKIGAIRCPIFEPHRCRSCGYDLTGLREDAGSCPECGHEGQGARVQA